MHSHSHTADQRPLFQSPGARLRIVFLLTFSFVGVEIAGGLYSGSLALLADAGHMLTDSMAIALSLFALWLAGRQTSLRRTYGFKRAEILAAFVNGFLLLVMAVWVIKEAIERLYQPRPVLDGVLFWVAVTGLLINVLALLLLRSHAHESLNIRSAVWHIAGDLLGSLGAIIAALVIRFTGWTLVDPLIGIGIALLIMLGSGRILLDSTNLLLDSVPRDIDSGKVRRMLARQEMVREVCDLHIWAASSSDIMLTAHLVVDEQANRDEILRHLSATLKEKFGFNHMTLQLEGSPQESCDETW